MASVLPDHNPARWITAQRRAKSLVDPFVPHRFFLERECAASGKTVSSGTILLTNKECPWRCLMCDLWKHTLSETVPPGAIPRQITYALARFSPWPQQLKLYNSGSFFDPAAIPPVDYAAIADAVSSASHVVVESHPRLVGAKALKFRDLLCGTLEVAMGLETIHPAVLPRLNKRVQPAHFAQAADFLRKERIAVRAFVLVALPFLSESEDLEWALKSAEFAFSCGAEVVSLIPTRPGNGAMDRLLEAGEFALPTISTIEHAQELALNFARGRVFVDTWDLETFSRCPACLDKRRHRLEQINLIQSPLPRVHCTVCEASSQTARIAPG